MIFTCTLFTYTCRDHGLETQLSFQTFSSGCFGYQQQ